MRRLSIWQVSHGPERKFYAVGPEISRRTGFFIRRDTAILFFNRQPKKHRGNMMESELTNELVQRVNGPFSLRLLLQPTMAVLFALRDGRADAQAGVEPYLSRIFFRPGQRRETVASAWASVGKVLVIAFLLDIAFQLATGGGFSPIESAVMASLLCSIPYTILRGPSARFFMRRR